MLLCILTSHENSWNQLQVASYKSQVAGLQVCRLQVTSAINLPPATCYLLLATCYLPLDISFSCLRKLVAMQHVASLQIACFNALDYTLTLHFAPNRTDEIFVASIPLNQVSYSWAEATLIESARFPFAIKCTPIPAGSRTNRPASRISGLNPARRSRFSSASRSATAKTGSVP